MTEPLLLNQYTRLVQRVEALPPTQHALVIGTVWLVVFTVTQLALGQPFLIAIVAGGSSAFVFASLQYYLKYYR